MTVLMLYRIGKEITLLKDEFSTLKTKSEALAEQGIETTFIDVEKEDEVRAILEKHGGKRQEIN